MWIAKDKSGELTLFKYKPIRNIPNSCWVEDINYGESNYFFLPEDLFELSWEDEPIEMELKVKE